MGQINPFSVYSTESVSLDRRAIGDRQGRKAPRDPKRQKPQAEDEVELHTDADETIPTPAEPMEEHGEDGHVDVTA
jgi:hypothetical protein